MALPNGHCQTFRCIPCNELLSFQVLQEFGATAVTQKVIWTVVRVIQLGILKILYLKTSVMFVR